MYVHIVVEQWGLKMLGLYNELAVCLTSSKRSEVLKGKVGMSPFSGMELGYTCLVACLIYRVIFTNGRGDLATFFRLIPLP